MTDVTTTALQIGILVPRPAEVETYLTECPELAPHIARLLPVAKRELGNDAELALEMFFGKPSQDHFLTLKVRQDQYAKNLVGRITAFFGQHCQFVNCVNGWFQVTTDFQKPLESPDGLAGQSLGAASLLGSPFRILSLGAGVQSSTLALMAATGETEHRLDAAIFADTQAEPDSVYRWLDWLESEIANSAYPFQVLRVTKGSLTEASLRVRTSKKTGLNYLKHSIPAYMKRANGAGGIMGRACTLDFKIIPVQQAAKEIAGVKRGQKTPIVEIWIGISRDEVIRMKPSREPWAVHVWPLIEAGMSRKDCLAWMESRGYPKPPRSSCAYCPYHSDTEWLRLQSYEPEAFAAAVAYEARLQASVSKICRLDGVPYLHSSRVPLASVDFNPTSTEPTLFGNECEGMCGV